MVAQQLHITRQHRKLFLQFLEQIPQEKLFEVPEGFNNHIFWNIAHVMVTQQLLVYKLSGLPTPLDEGFVARYSKGSFPAGDAQELADLALVKAGIVSAVDQLESDYASGIFAQYNPYTTSTKVTLNNVAEAIGFNNFHEGLHLGSVLALRRVLGIA
ncbi:MAG: hypothetical protein RLZZ463_18 [Bacteroidota bacterium]